MTRALLIDRDGTLVVDVPGNRNPAAIALMPTAAEALRVARTAGWRIAVITNQPDVGAGTLAQTDLARLHARIDALAGPIDAWFVCPHVQALGCACRKPRPGLIFAALEHFGAAARACVLVGDIGADVEAARAAGVASVLVPTPLTRVEEVRSAPCVAPNLLAAVRLAVAA